MVAGVKSIKKKLRNKTMIKNLLEKDKKLFLRINRSPHRKLINYFFLFFDYLTFGGVAWFFICFGLIFFGNKSSREFGFWGLAIVLFTMIVAGFFLKKLIVRRPRPFLSLDGVRVWSFNPKSLSFPSEQTAGVFALATFYGLHYHSAWPSKITFLGKEKNFKSITFKPFFIIFFFPFSLWVFKIRKNETSFSPPAGIGSKKPYQSNFSPKG